MSNYDYATIKATWLNQTDPNFQCKKAEEILSKRKDADVVIKLRRKENGCGVMKDSPKIMLDEIGYHSCLCNQSYQNPLLHALIELSDDCENGILPESGGSLDQSAMTMELISLINSLKQERQIKLQELEAKRNKHG